MEATEVDNAADKAELERLQEKLSADRSNFNVADQDELQSAQERIKERDGEATTQIHASSTGIKSFALLAMLVVYPIISQKLFRMVPSICRDLLLEEEDGWAAESWHADDYRVDCTVDKHRAMTAVSFALIALIPFGCPYFFLHTFMKIMHKRSTASRQLRNTVQKHRLLSSLKSMTRLSIDGDELWIGDIPDTVLSNDQDEEETEAPIIEQLLEEFGHVLKVTVRKKPGDNKSWALVRFQDAASTKQAIQQGLRVQDASGAYIDLRLRRGDPSKLSTRSAISRSHSHAVVATAQLKTTSTASQTDEVSDNYAKLNAQYSFMVSDYKPAYYFWEVVVMSQKVILTAAIGVIRRGTSEQIVLALFIALFFMVIHTRCWPYQLELSNYIKLGVEVNICVVYIVTLALRHDSSLESTNRYGWILLISTVGLTPLAMLYAFFSLETKVDVSNPDPSMVDNEEGDWVTTV
eukprot:COSAG01_NODE_14436_length_1454_cov_1.529889_1_plen_464_part_10